MKWVIVPVGHLASLAETVGIYRDEMAKYVSHTSVCMCLCNHEITARRFFSLSFAACTRRRASIAAKLVQRFADSCEHRTRLPCNFFDEFGRIGRIKLDAKIQIVRVIGSFELPGYSGRLIQPMLQ